MNIAYIVQYYPPHTGGLEKVAQKQAQSAANAGHEVSVVTFALPNAPAGTRREGDVVVHRVRGNHFFDTRFGIPFCLGGVTMVRTVMRVVRDADMVHLHDVFYMTSLVGYLSARWYKKPLMLTQHVALVAHSSRLVLWVERAVYALWGRAIFRASVAIVTYQKIVRDFLLAQGVPSGRIIEMHNGVELDRFHPVSDEEKRERRRQLGLPVGKPLALFVGRMVSKKGYRELFSARDPAHYDLVFVGPGKVPAEWHHIDGVHVLGSRTQEEVMYLMPAMDVCVVPSVGEMFTLSMQEAMACGLAVVTTDMPEYAEYDLDPKGIVRCARTAHALQTELRRVTADVPLVKYMGTYARSVAEALFDWEKNVQKILARYTTLHTPSVTCDAVRDTREHAKILWKNAHS